jgi:hypothetical protein
MNEIAGLLAGSLLALGLAWLWDRLFIVSGVNQRLRTGLLIPIGEEVVKLGIFNLLHLSPPLLYGLFGLGEGLLESFGLPRRYKITLIFAGCITHTIFSLFYLTVFSLYFQLILAICAHCLWNFTVLHLKIQKYS